MLAILALVVSHAALLRAPGGARAPRVSRAAMLAPNLASASAYEDEDARPPFDFDRSVELASLAFHTYVPVTGGKWERGSDQTDVAFQRAGFVAECYSGVLVVTLKRVRGLPDEAKKAGAGEALLTGGALDPYVLLSVVEGRKVVGKGEDELPVRDVCRSRTLWRMGKGGDEGAGEQGGGREAARRPPPPARKPEAGVAEFDETFYLYVSDLSSARIRLILRDENVAKEDDTLGTATLPVAPMAARPGADMLQAVGVKYSAPIGPGMAAGAVAGGLFGGPVGAGLGAAAAAIAERWMREATVELSVKWVPFGQQPTPAAGGAGGAAGGSSDEAMAAVAASALSETETADIVARAVAKAQAAMRVRLGVPEAAAAEGAGAQPPAAPAGAAAAPAAAPAALSGARQLGALGGTEGIDWTALGGPQVDPRRFELIAYVDNSATDTQATLWRDAGRRELVLSFRGTEQTAWKDLLIDAMVLQQPWSQGGADAAGARAGALEPSVHSGFRTAWASVAPRVLELIAGAIGARTYDADSRARALRRPRWTLYCTGHSLGGALATLAALELGQSALPLARIGLYTFGAPRVGNADLCALVDSYVPEGFRIVNGQDLVTRMPRGAAAETLGRFAGGILDYRHPGRTVLVDEREPLCAVAGAGLERECPLELLDSPFADPLSSIDGARGGGGGAVGAPVNVDSDGVPDARLLPAVEDLIDGIAGAAGGRAAGEGALGALQRAAEQVAQTLSQQVSGTGKGVSLKDVASLVGIQGRFVEAELSLLSSITSGVALAHHLEPSYYAAMKNAQAAVRDGKTPEGRKAS